MKRGRLSVGAISLFGTIVLILIEVFSPQLQKALSLSEMRTLAFELAVAIVTVLVVVNLVLHLSSSQNESTVRKVEETSVHLLASVSAQDGHVSLLTSEGLYRELNDSVEASKSRIYTTYMGNTPPGTPVVASKRAYFQAMRDYPRRHPGVVVRRIFLATPSNAAWIRDLADGYRDLGNVSVAAYIAVDGQILPLSVQLFDNQRAFIVHVAEKPPGQPRDLSLASEKAASVLDGYYEALWRASAIVLDSGRLVQPNLSRLKTVETSEQSTG